MTFTTFIKRPVLSTVISILIVLLGFIGLVSLPIEQYPNIAPPTVAVWTSYPGADAETVKNSYRSGMDQLSWCRCGNGEELRCYAIGGEYQRCGGHGLYYIYVFHRIGTALCVVPPRHEPGYVCRQRAEPCVAGSGAVACRGDTYRCDGVKAPDLTGADVYADL